MTKTVEDRIREFQASRGLEPDGFIGSMTWGAIEVELAVGERCKTQLRAVRLDNDTLRAQLAALQDEGEQPFAAGPIASLWVGIGTVLVLVGGAIAAAMAF